MATATATATVTADAVPGQFATATATVTASLPGNAATATATVTALVSGAKITTTRTTAWNVFMPIVPYRRSGGAWRAGIGYHRIAGAWVRFTSIPPTPVPPSNITTGRVTTWNVAAATGSTTWQQRLQQATLAAPRRISILGDSIMFGAASTGVSNPKWLNSPPGRLRSLLIPTYGDAGTGLVLAFNASNGIHANPAYDPRWIYTGTITDTLLAYHRQGVFTIPTGGTSFIQFVCGNAPSTAVDAFRVHLLAGTGGSATVQVDSGGTSSIRSSSASTVTISPDAGMFSTHYVTRVPAGALGAHTLKVSGNGGSVQVYGMEGIRTGQGRFIVDNVSESSKSLGTFTTSDLAGGTYGLPFIDSLKADLLIVQLMANDWIAGTATATAQTYMNSIIDRQQATGNDAAIMIPPIPSPTLQPAGGPTWAQYRTMLTAAASAQGVPILDLSGLWSADSANPTYAEGNTLGKYADTIHPNDSGAADIAAAMKTFLGL